MEYLHGGDWIFAGDHSAENPAVEHSRKLWKRGVAGVRVLRISTTVHKEAVRETKPRL